ncbi:hypothetical protein [Paenibacillus sp. 481]|uniref:hypothetical protein n=1 Tax=Paenibacillus sp. 481 TaxID=2835869 RepID=UPI001E463ACD|nr:hypothetical protein [Paenibacillus sp. 481]UHA73544.1 hypothetical protein KIK04_23850 [Paenibacillus sp. 481]
MNKKFLAIAIALLLIVGAVFVYIYFQSDEYRVKQYVKNEYGVNVEIIKLSREGIFSNKKYTVSPKNHKDIQFTVVIDYTTDSVIADNYARALEVDNELHKLEKVIPDVEKLGFKDGINDEIRVGFTEEKNSLFLHSISPIEIATFAEKELGRFFELQKLIKQSGALIHHVSVYDMREPSKRKSIHLDMEKIKSVTTKEQLLSHIKKSNWEMVSFYENKKWESEKASVENGRFTFGTKYDEYWFNCRETNEKGECSNILVTLSFKENSLTKANSNLEQDFNSIFTLFEETITPKAKIEYIFIEDGASDPVRFTEQEIAKFGTTSNFIAKNFK